MQLELGRFLREGGNSTILLKSKGNSLFVTRLHAKANVPNHAGLRRAFEERLDEVIEENTRFLLQVLTPPDSVPVFTAADLADMSAFKAEVIAEWDRRLTRIHTEHQVHPRRVRVLHQNMEERLARAFARAINQLRQEDLGVERYVWRSRDDDRVRSSHAENDDQVFRWDSPPSGGHPGQAPNCRCYAEPVPPGTVPNVILVDVPAILDSSILPDAAQVIRGLRALTSGGAAILASEAASRFVDRMREHRFLEAARIVGADLTTVEGHLAATAYGRVYEAVISGFSSLPKNSDAARVAGEAAALFEMMNSGTILAASSGELDAQIALGRFVEDAYRAFEQGRLSLQADELAEGWVEVFPELTEGERRLEELPGFAVERLDQLAEAYPIEELGLPHHTGHGRPGDPTGGVIATPIPEGGGPDAVVMARPGEPTPIQPSDDFETRRGVQRENESAVILKERGFDVVQNPVVPGPKNPDYLIGGKIYDHIAPSTGSARNIWSRVKEKIEDGQAPNIVIGLQDSTVDEGALRQQFADWPIDGLGDVIIVRGDGSVGRL